MAKKVYVFRPTVCSIFEDNFSVNLSDLAKAKIRKTGRNLRYKILFGYINMFSLSKC